MNLLVLNRFGDMGASSRMRVLQYLPEFESGGVNPTVLPLFSNSDLKARYATGRYGAATIASRYFSRISSLLSKQTADLIWIEKELIPWAPAWFEKLLLGGRRYVMDFDDAIFHNYDRHRLGLIRGVYGRKIDRMMKNAALVLAGNEYLASRARDAGCQNVEIVPTVIDLNKYPVSANGDRDHSEDTVIGWIGSPYTTKYLQQLEGPLTELSREHRIRFRVIGGRPVSFEGVNIESLEWAESEESNMLSECDIGVMPLPDSPWERGKCGYKLIQYMACSKPVIGSPVGVNQQIVTPEIGFLCETDSQWSEALLKLTQSSELRHRMGQAGRAAVEEKYCVQKTGPIVVRLLKKLVSETELASSS